MVSEVLGMLVFRVEALVLHLLALRASRLFVCGFRVEGSRVRGVGKELQKPNSQTRNPIPSAPSPRRLRA